MAKQPPYVPLGEFEPPENLTEEEFLAVYADEVDEAAARAGIEERHRLLAAGVVTGNLKLCRHICCTWGRSVIGVVDMVDGIGDECEAYLRSRLRTEIQDLFGDNEPF